MIKAIAVVLMLGIAPPAAQLRDLLQVSGEARKAHEAKDYKQYLRLAEEMRQIAPRHSQVLWAYARANALTGNREKAVEVLNRLADIEAYFDAAASPDLQSLRDREDFKRVLARLEQLKQPVANSTVAFTLSDRALIPESIAYDPKDGGFFVGSIHKRMIVKRLEDGKTVEFVRAAQDGLEGVLGIKLDPQRRELWANACNENTGSAAIYRFHADTGKLIRKYVVATKDKPGCVNDLVIAPNGDVYSTSGTGPLSGNVLRVARGSDSAEVWFTPEGTGHGFNGITISDDGKTLYLADNIYGVMAVDIASKGGRVLDAPEKTAMEQIDGLYFYKGTLVAVQNARSLMRVVQFTMDPQRARITGHRTLERSNPHFTVPTTGVLVDDELFYIANTELDALSPEGGLKGEPKEPVILRVKLGE